MMKRPCWSGVKSGVVKPHFPKVECDVVVVHLALSPFVRSPASSTNPFEAESGSRRNQTGGASLRKR